MLPTFSRQLEDALGYPISATDFLDLESTARLRDTFVEILKNRTLGHRIFWRPDQTADMWQTVASIVPLVVGKRVALFHPDTLYLGAVMVPADVALSAAQNLWSIGEEDLWLTTLDLSDGFYLAFDHYPDHEEYKLVTWGAFVPSR